MAITRTLSVDVVCAITHQLNNQILLHGELQKNNKFIWKHILHTMSNDVWIGALQVLLEVCDQHPLMCNWNDRVNLLTALSTIQKYATYYDNVMDISNQQVHHKALAWRNLMIMREIITRCWGIDLPNHNSSKKTNQFDQVFQQESE